MIKIPIKDELGAILSAKAKRESKQLIVLVNEIISKALWDEPEVIFKGKSYRVEPDLFNSFEPEVKPS